MTNFSDFKSGNRAIHCVPVCELRYRAWCARRAMEAGLVSRPQVDGLGKREVIDGKPIPLPPAAYRSFAAICSGARLQLADWGRPDCEDSRYGRDAFTCLARHPIEGRTLTKIPIRIQFTDDIWGEAVGDPAFLVGRPTRGVGARSGGQRLNDSGRVMLDDV